MKARSIRVNFRFGPRTDPELLREIAALPPYRRARLLRKLLEVGWRTRTDPPQETITPPSRDHRLVHSPTPQADDPGFAQDVLDLLGKSVRI